MASVEKTCTTHPLERLAEEERRNRKEQKDRTPYTLKAPQPLAWREIDCGNHLEVERPVRPVNLLEVDHVNDSFPLLGGQRDDACNVLYAESGAVYSEDGTRQKVDMYQTHGFDVLMWSDVKHTPFLSQRGHWTHLDRTVYAEHILDEDRTAKTDVVSFLFPMDAANRTESDMNVVLERALIECPQDVYFDDGTLSTLQDAFQKYHFTVIYTHNVDPFPPKDIIYAIAYHTMPMVPFRTHHHITPISFHLGEAANGFLRLEPLSAQKYMDNLLNNKDMEEQLEFDKKT